MPDNSVLPGRKADHIHINLEQDVSSTLTTGLEQYRFIHRALPEIDFEDIDLSLTLFGKSLRAPILISSMTGGTPEAALINQRLAETAEKMAVALGVGSQRAAIEHPDLVESYRVRRYAPSTLLFANLGAVQLNYSYTVEECWQAVDMIEADALILHLNPLQEALQPEGDTQFSNLLKKIENVCRALPVPVIAKEVGWGISEADARSLVSAGVAAIDVAGAGGTSWSQVEMYRAQNPILSSVAAAFRNWGIPTAESILLVRRVTPDLPVFASGGLCDGVDIAKSIALGADMGGMAGPFLKAASQSAEDVQALMDVVIRQLKVCMFIVGAQNLAALRQDRLRRIGE